jgi:hypothetical protein
MIDNQSQEFNDQLRKFNDVVKDQLIRLTCKIIADNKSNKKLMSEDARRELEHKRDLIWAIENSIDGYLLKFDSK